MKDNIIDRFSESLPVFSAFKIFDPTAIPGRSDEPFKNYGIREINIYRLQIFIKRQMTKKRKRKSLDANGKSSYTVYFS